MSASPIPFTARCIGTISNYADKTIRPCFPFIWFAIAKGNIAKKRIMVFCPTVLSERCLLGPYCYTSTPVASRITDKPDERRWGHQPDRPPPKDLSFDSKQWQSQFEALQLSESEVRKLYKLFQTVDADGGGTIKINELLTYLDIEKNKFTQRVFAVFDEDGSGVVDFREFVVALWNYCTLGNGTLVIFSFDLYDGDSSGIIDASEVDAMLKEIYGYNYSKNVHAQRISEKIGALALVDVTKETFAEFVRWHPALLFPAFEMQRNIQRRCLGSRFWQKVSKRRVQISEGRFLSVEEIVQLMNHRAVEERPGNVNFDALFKEKGPHGRRGSRHSSVATNMLPDICPAEPQQTHTYINKVVPADDELRRVGGRGPTNDCGGPDRRALTLDILSSSVGSHAKRRASAGTIEPMPSRSGAVAVADVSIHAGVKAADTEESRRRTFPRPLEEQRMIKSSVLSSGGTGKREGHHSIDSGNVVGWQKVHAGEPVRRDSKSRRPSRGSLEAGATYQALLAGSHTTNGGASPGSVLQRESSRRKSAPLIIPVSKSEFARGG